jgi:hypothetical protein
VAGRANEKGAIESARKHQRQVRQRGGDAVERDGGRTFLGVGANCARRRSAYSPNFACCVSVLPVKCCSTKWRIESAAIQSTMASGIFLLVNHGTLRRKCPSRRGPPRITPFVRSLNMMAKRSAGV